MKALLDSPTFLGLGTGLGAGARGSVVMGETMARVIAKADAVGASYYKTRVTININTAEGLQRALRNNYQWFRRQYLQGKKLIDIGIDKLRSERSPFYKMEQKFKDKWGW